MDRLRLSCFWLIILGAFFISSALAMDEDLWQLPQLPGSSIVWKDQPMEVNQIKANATHLRTDLPVDKILQFYKSALEPLGWKYDKNLTPEISTFVKENKFIYVGIFPLRANVFRDVYLIVSPASLTICEELKDYFFKEHIMPDAQGKDLEGVPRYPGSRRRLDIFLSPQSGVLIYESDGAPRDIARFFRQEMPRNGWREEHALSAEVVQKLNPLMRGIQILLFNRGNNKILFNITAIPKGLPVQAKAFGRTLIIIARNMEKEVAFPKRHPELTETPGPDRNGVSVRPVAKEGK